MWYYIFINQLGVKDNAGGTFTNFSSGDLMRRIWTVKFLYQNGQAKVENAIDRKDYWLVLTKLLNYLLNTK